MKLALVTSYPPSKVTLNEYAFHLVKHFRQHQDVTELIVLSDCSIGTSELYFDVEGCSVRFKKCWSFNNYKNLFTVLSAIHQIKPDAILFNLQFMKFGDKKIAAALGLLLPLCCKFLKIPTIVLLHNIIEQVDLNTAGFAKNKLLKKVYSTIGTVLTRILLKADKVAVTIQSYVDILEEKYGAKNVVLIPHGTFEIPDTPNYELPKAPS